MYLLYVANKQPLYVLLFRSFFLLFETLNMEISLMENYYNLFIFRKMEMKMKMLLIFSLASTYFTIYPRKCKAIMTTNVRIRKIKENQGNMFIT